MFINLSNIMTYNEVSFVFVENKSLGRVNEGLPSSSLIFYEHLESQININIFILIDFIYSLRIDFL